MNNNQKDSNLSLVGLIPQWATPQREPGAIPVRIRRAEGLGAGQSRRRVPGRPPRPRPPRRPAHPHTFPLAPAVARASSRRLLLGLLLLLCWLTTHFQDAGGHRAPEVVRPLQGLAPLPEPGTGPRRASHAQPRRPARRCGAGLLPRGPLGGQALPTAPSPTPRPSNLVPQPLQGTLTAVPPRDHASTCPQAQRRAGHPLCCRSPVLPGPARSGTPSAPLPAQRPQPCTDGSFQECPLRTAAVHSPHRGASLEAGSTALSAEWLRVPPKLRLGPEAVRTPVTMQGQQRLFPTPTPDSNASNRALLMRAPQNLCF